MTPHRRPIYFNPDARCFPPETSSPADLNKRFHDTLKTYTKTPLVSLQSVAEDVGVKAIYIKDESHRLGSSSFDILGVSWAIFRALANRLDLPLDSGFEAAKARLSTSPIPLYAVASGNRARAVARMGSMLSIPVNIYIPVPGNPNTTDVVRQEGASVIVASSSEAALEEASAACKEKDGIFFHPDEGSGEDGIPRWIVDGLSTLSIEVDEQLHDGKADVVICPAGDGSLAQALVTHYKANGQQQTRILTVEPDTACPLWKSLSRGEFVNNAEATDTIMQESGNSGLSKTAWQCLRAGADASLTISDWEAHKASLELRDAGISVSPGGASSLAAIRRLDEQSRSKLSLSNDSVIVLICTESLTKYDIPKDVSSEDVIELTQTLVRINSANPDFGSVPGPGETVIANYITAWLQHRDIETHRVEPTPGRPSIIGVVRGSGNGKSIMLNGHIDTVTVLGYDDDPLSGHIADGNLYGRGAADMKSGLAAEMIALVRAKGMKLKGDVIFAASADEESESIGTEQLIAAGWRADAAIVAEPTEMALINTHKGFALFEVDIHGVASHGSRADLGIDAICKAGYFLVELDRHAQELQQRFKGKQIETGSPNIHAGMIKGGEEIASYPACCTISIERRTIAGETAETVRAELLSILEGLAATVPDFKYELRSTFSRAPYFIAKDHEFVELVARHAAEATGTVPAIKGETYWTDMALFGEVGIPGLIWGPKGYGLHAKKEWVEVESVRQLAEAFTTIVGDFCK